MEFYFSGWYSALRAILCKNQTKLEMKNFYPPNQIYMEVGPHKGCVKINELRMNSYCPFLFSILYSCYNFMLSFQDASALSITGLAQVLFTRGTARRSHR